MVLFSFPQEPQRMLKKKLWRGSRDLLRERVCPYWTKWTGLLLKYMLHVLQLEMMHMMKKYADIIKPVSNVDKQNQ